MTTADLTKQTEALEDEELDRKVKQSLEVLRLMAKNYALLKEAEEARQERNALARKIARAVIAWGLIVAAFIAILAATNLI